MTEALDSTLPTPDIAPLNPDAMPPVEESIDYQNEEERQRLLRLQIVDQSHGVHEEAADASDEYLREQTTQRGVQGFIKKIWVGNLARDYIRQREISRNRQEIVDSNNLYVKSGGTEEDYQRASAAVVGRFTSDYLHEGETNENAEVVSGGDTFHQHLNELVESYARGDLTDDSLEEEKNRLIQEFGQQLHAADRNRGLMLADNTLLVARHAKAAFEHGVGLDNIVSALSVHVGDARMGVRTEASKEMVDRVIDKLYGTRVGSAVNETTVAVAASIGMSIAKATTTRGFSALTRTVGIGIGSGVIAGVREWHHTAQERRLHSRQMAEGGEVNIGHGKRRERMEATRYETVSGTRMINDLTNAQLEYSEEPNADKARALLAEIVAVQTRISMSDELGKDLIQYSGKTRVEQERSDLDITLAKAKVALRHAIDSSDDETLRAISGGVNRDVAALIRDHSAQVRSKLEMDISDKDVAFTKLRLARAASAAAVGATVGVLLGEAVQGGEHLGGALTGSHVLAFSHASGHAVIAHAASADFAHSSFQLDNGALNLPSGYHLLQAANGNELVGPGNHVLGHIEFDNHGHLTAASEHIMQQHGFTLRSTTESFDTSHVVTSQANLTPEQYIQANPEKFTDVHRELWFGNNTTKPDLNELDLRWGGQHFSGIDQHGNFVFDITKMTPNGSFEGANAANVPQLIHDHKMFIAISLDRASQNHVIMVPINEQGQAVFDPNNPALKSVFTVENGQTHFTGAYAEVVEVTGHGANNVDNLNVFATVVGDNHPAAIQETVQSVVHGTGEHVVTFADLSEKVATHVQTPAEMDLVLPLRSRTGMETLHKSESIPNTPSNHSNYEGGYYGRVLEERQRHWRSERSPRLREHPDINLNTGDELAWYRQEQASRRGQEYINEIDGNIQNSEVLRDLGGETKAIVCIPVAAANEAENIYKTLSLYAQQGEKANSETVVLLNLNWKQELESDPKAMAKIRKTHEEIKRAQAAFPNLRIATFDKVWTPDFLRRRTDEQGNVRMYGEVIKVLYDTAAFAVGNAVQAGRRPSEAEAILITNDADAQGMNRRYLDHYIQALEEHPTADVFAGAIRWGTKEYSEYPGYGLSSGFYAVINMVTQRSKNKGSLSTTGPNAGFRMSAYAAVGGCQDDDLMGASADAVLGQRVLKARNEQVPITASYESGYPSKRNKGYNSYAIKSRRSTSPREVSRHIGGAQIDTLADRLLGAYRRGEWIAAGWNGFDSGGYQDRGVSASKGNLPPENPAKDIDDIAQRLKVNIEGFINGWYREPGMAASALALYFGTRDKEGRPLYKAWWEGKPGWDVDSDGHFHLDFTPEGKKQLQKQLLKDARGRRDPYGPRLRRKLYSELQSGDKHQALAIPRYVAHTN